MALIDKVRKTWHQQLGWYTGGKVNGGLAMNRNQAYGLLRQGLLPKDTVILDRRAYMTLNAQKPNKKKTFHPSAGKKKNPRFGAF